MDNEVKVTIYGDSIMRGTVIDSGLRYHATIADYLRRLAGCFGLDICNKARFGSTVERGSKQLEQDLKNGLSCQYAVVEYGGNDCSFLWDEVAAAPAADHQPLTPPERFEQTLAGMVRALRRQKVEPVLMTLPPIDAQRHLEFIGKDERSRRNILQWLGDVQMIYRFHEMYSSIVAQVAQLTGSILVDVRKRFLARHDMASLVGMDGVHPSSEGYRLISTAFKEFIEARRSGAPGRLVYG